MVPLADPQEVDNIPVQVIEHFNLGGALVKKHLGTAGKGFHVGSVLGQQRDNLGGEAILAADVGEGTNHEIEGLKVKEVFDLAVQAKRQGILDQRRCKAAVDAGPDCGNELAHLIAETRARMSERCQHVQL